MPTSTPYWQLESDFAHDDAIASLINGFKRIFRLCALHRSGSRGPSNPSCGFGLHVLWLELGPATNHISAVLCFLCRRQWSPKGTFPVTAESDVINSNLTGKNNVVQDLSSDREREREREVEISILANKSAKTRCHKAVGVLRIRTIIFG